MDVYLDIETDWDRNLTLVGFHSEVTGVVQLVGGDITADRLRTELPSGGNLYTYNGHCFDLPVIHKQLGLHLRTLFDSHDLRWICQRNGIRGGQKSIEERIGVRRQLTGLSGMDAMVLWTQHLQGDPDALTTLLGYNREDLDGLVAIRTYLSRRKLITA